jgi:hypothetical protein
MEHSSQRALSSLQQSGLSKSQGRVSMQNSQNQKQKENWQPVLMKNDYNRESAMVVDQLVQ